MSLNLTPAAEADAEAFSRAVAGLAKSAGAPAIVAAMKGRRVADIPSRDRGAILATLGAPADVVAKFEEAARQEQAMIGRHTAAAESMWQTAEARADVGAFAELRRTADENARKYREPIKSVWSALVEQATSRAAELETAATIKRAEAEADKLWREAEANSAAADPMNRDQPFAALARHARTQADRTKHSPAVSAVWDYLAGRAYCQSELLALDCEQLRAEAKAADLYASMGLDTCDTPQRRFAGVFMEGCVSVIYAAKGYGKTTLALEMLLKAAAAGECRLLYVAVDAPEIARRSFRSALRRHKLDGPHNAHRVHLVADRGCSLVPAVEKVSGEDGEEKESRYGPSPARARITEKLWDMFALADGMGSEADLDLPSVVLFDTFAAGMGGRDAASSAAVAATNELLTLLDWDRGEDEERPSWTPAAIVVLHHSRQSDDKTAAGRAEILNGTEGAYRIERRKRGEVRRLVVERDKFDTEGRVLLEFSVRNNGTREQPDLEAVICEGPATSTDSISEETAVIVPAWVPADLRPAYEALAAAEPEDGFVAADLNAVLDRIGEAMHGKATSPGTLRKRRFDLRSALSAAGILRPTETGRTIISTEKEAA